MVNTSRKIYFKRQNLWNITHFKQNCRVIRWTQYCFGLNPLLKFNNGRKDSLWNKYRNIILVRNVITLFAIFIFAMIIARIVKIGVVIAKLIVKIAIYLVKIERKIITIQHVISNPFWKPMSLILERVWGSSFFLFIWNLKFILFFQTNLSFDFFCKFPY